MKTFKCTLQAATYGHAKFGTYTRPFTLVLNEDDPRLPTFRATRAWKVEEIGAFRPRMPLPPEAIAPAGTAKPKPTVADLSALDSKDAGLLAAEGITTLDEVIEMGEDGLQHIHGIGEATAKRIMVAANKAVNASEHAQARAAEQAALAEAKAEDENA